MEQVVPRLSEFQGKPVTFLSLSVAGWQHGSPPDAQFLKEWQQKHNIPFPVLASGKADMSVFGDPPYSIPAAVIVDKDGKVAYIAMPANYESYMQEIHKLVD